MDDIERRLKDLGDRTAQEVTYREVPRRRIVRRARVRRGLTLAAPVVAVVLFAAVAYPRLDSTGGRGVPVAVDLAAAAEATENAGSARVEFSMSVDFETTSFTTTAVGEVDFDDARSYLRGTNEDASGGAGEFEVIMIGNLSFERAGGDPKWTKTELDMPAGTTPFGTGTDELFTYLESVSEEVVSLGEEVLDGARVTHLSATIDTSALSEMPQSEGMRFEPIHVWIDDANRVRKLTFGMSIEGPDPSMNGTSSMTMRFWDFGVPVDVTAPDPDDVTDEPLKGFDSGGSGSVGATVSTPETQFVHGKHGPADPFLTLTGYGDPRSELVCVQGMPQGATGATLVHEKTFEIVAIFAPRKGRGSSLGVACAPPGFGHADVDALLGNPSEYLLRIERQRGPTVVVPLTTSGMPLIDE